MLFIIFFITWLVLMLVIAVANGDFTAILKGDPAARNIFEVLTYPSLYAVSMHRVNHLLFRLKIPFIPRFFSQTMRWLTHIEIHPGAKIGRAFFIDHGAGIVIGETAEIGHYVIMYHQVTLGGTGKETGKRHPTIGHHVILGAGSKILGNIRIGHHCKVGAGAVVLRDVPDHCTVVGNPGRVVKTMESDIFETLDLGNVPDPLLEEQDRIEKQINDLRKSLGKVKK